MTKAPKVSQPEVLGAARAKPANALGLNQAGKQDESHPQTRIPSTNTHRPQAGFPTTYRQRFPRSQSQPAEHPDQESPPPCGLTPPAKHHTNQPTTTSSGKTPDSRAPKPHHTAHTRKKPCTHHSPEWCRKEVLVE